MIPRARLSLAAVRAFSSSARVQKHVSHIGGKPILLPPNVSFDTSSPTSLTVSGPLGITSLPLFPFVHINFSSQPSENDGEDLKLMNVSIEDSAIKVQRQMWGTTRTHIHNAIIGMTEGFKVPIYLVGVGYRAQLEADPRGTSEGGNGQRLAMKLGYSHSVYVPVPNHIQCTVPSPTKIVLFCTDKHLLGLFAAKVRSYRKPEPYKGKGIFVGDEKIRIKSIKKK